ncbi:hypothetical protein N8350_01345 [Candidatus Nanopelagicales bacterium]|nr:hypothetical protein [Actinomycetota bacterium]MDC1474241.1 hypothetical protein [Candidatus Nanopelagicales bacterium]
MTLDVIELKSETATPLVVKRGAQWIVASLTKLSGWSPDIEFTDLLSLDAE